MALHFLDTAVRITNPALYTMSLIQNKCTWLWIILNIPGNIRRYIRVLHNLHYKRRLYLTESKYDF
jgi:hypothetical protein